MASILDSLEPLKDSVEPAVGAEDELWLLSVPIDFPVEALNGVSLNLTGCNSLTTETKNGTYDANTVKLDSSILPLIPSKKPGKLSFGSELAGHITFKRCVPLNDIEPPAKKKKTSLEVSDKLRQRWKPFGMENPKGTKTRKGKKSKKRKCKE